MTTISLSSKLVLITVFTVAPDKQQQLLELLARATETSVRHAPGFISASLHRGLDGTKVTMYAQWRTVEDYEAMREDPAPLQYFRQALAIARFDPGLYEVVETYAGTAPGRGRHPLHRTSLTEPSKKYPALRSVIINRGSAGSASILRRRRMTCVSIERS